MSSPTIRLISWNVAHRNRCAEQVAALARFSPDIVALQEITRTTVGVLKDSLREHGLGFMTDSFDEPSAADPYGVLVASKWTVERTPVAASVPLRQRLLTAMVKTPKVEIEVNTAYVKPGSSDARLKLETLEYIYTTLAGSSRRPRILCGDFNAPQAETAKGEIVTWGQRVALKSDAIVTKKTWRGMPGKRYDKAERDVLEGLEKNSGLVELFRHFHPGEVQDFSWYNAKHQGRRFDHIFSSMDLNPIGCTYIHDLRKKPLSDHSAIEAEFQPPPTN